MNIVLLASNPLLYSNKRIMEEATRRGHNIRFISIEKCYIDISSHKPEIIYEDGQSITGVDVVIPRIKPKLTFYGNAVLRQFILMGALPINDAESIEHSRNKLYALQILSAHGVEIPTTGFSYSPENTKALIKMVGGAPLIVKLLEGTQGMGVVLAETQKASESVIRAFKMLHTHILVQQFIKESAGRDIRCFVIGSKVVGAAERRSSDGDFRSNIHLGGTAHPVKITTKEKNLAIKAVKALNLHIAGVDLIRSNNGPRILEVNSSPGLEGIEGATKLDIAALMFDHIDEMMKKNKGKKRK